MTRHAESGYYVPETGPGSRYLPSERSFLASSADGSLLCLRARKSYACVPNNLSCFLAFPF